MIRVGLINGKSAPSEGSVDSQSLTEKENKLKVLKLTNLSFNSRLILDQQYSNTFFGNGRDGFKADNMREGQS